MSIKTEESLNCPCNGIYKCDFHSAVLIKYNNPYSKTEMDKLCEIYLQNFKMTDYVSPWVTTPPENITWPKLHLALIDSKEFD